MTERRKFLLQILGTIQNHPFNHHRDIMTFAGLCTTDELAQHVADCAAQIDPGMLKGIVMRKAA